MTSLNEPNHKAISLIVKLLALANDGGATEAEAQLAMSKAQELMAEHNLTMAALEQAGGEGEKRQRLQHEKKLMFVWKRELLQVVAEVNFCHVTLQYASTRFNETNVVGYTLIGRESNVVAVRDMFHYLLETIERLVVAEFSTAAPARGSRPAHSFRLGASDRLKDRLSSRHEKKLRDQERDAKERQAAARHPGAATGNALVVVLRDYAQQETDLNTDVRMGREPGTTARKRAEAEATQEARSRKIKELEAQGIAWNVANYMSAGFTRDRADELCRPEPEKQETDAQRRKREEREVRASERYRKQARARQWREDSKIDRSAFRRGGEVADGVGLDDQIDRNRQKKLS